MTSKAMATILVTLVVLVTTFSTNVSADDELNSVEFVSINSDNGQNFAQVVNLTGESSIAASELLWSISNLDTVNSVASESEVLLESSIFTNVTISNDIYYWELSIPANGLNCTCLFTITTTDNSLDITDFMIIFIGTESHFPIISYVPSFQTYANNGVKYLEYNVTFPENDYQNNIESINPASFIANICLFSGNSCITEETQVELNYSVTESGNFLLEIDNIYLAIEDGNWNFEIFMRDSFLRYSNAVETVLTFDTRPPEVTILGAVSAKEMTSEVYSAVVDDGYENSLVALTWTITEPNGLVRAVMPQEMITDSSIGVEFNQSGIWDISVLAVDSVGYFTKETYSIIVENLVPEIYLETSANRLDADSKIILNDGENWFIDASGSSDTINDQDGLSYVWKIDDIIIHSEANLSQEIISRPGEYSLTLEVTDEDGATSYSTLELQIMANAGSDINSNNYLAVITLLVIVLLAVSLLLRLRKPDSAFNLPKWGK
ncbi:hypothetical protein OA314_00140 [bacterium]|nr:hypothetical protein [bacterium]